MNLNNLFPFLQIFSCQRTQLEHAEEDVLLLLHPGNPPQHIRRVDQASPGPPGPDTDLSLVKSDLATRLLASDWFTVIT